MAATRRLTELVDSTRARLRLPLAPVTVALSGGADSAALAYLAVDVEPYVSLLHVDHGFSASNMLRSAAGRIAEQLDLPLQIVAVEVPTGGSPESQARDARYEVLEGTDRNIATGHTRDDAVETMLINLIRGTGIDGLGGIPYHRPPNIYRPMLDISRSETREIAALAGLEFRDDPMNDDLDLARNRIRQLILPRMRELNPRVNETMARTAAGLRADAAFLDEMARCEPGDTLAVGPLVTLPRALADRVLRRWLEAHGVEVTAHLMGRAWSVATGGSERQDLESGRCVVRDGAVLKVEKGMLV